MTTEELSPILGIIAGMGTLICMFPLLLYVVFPFFENFSQEKKLEKFIDEKCLEGNQIAIRIRRQNFSYYSKRDYKLIRAAIQGNEHAIKALKLDAEK